MRRRPLAITLIAVLAALVALAGCAKRKSVLRPNAPPETSLYVSGPISTVSHRVHLYWFGTDFDGEVVAYEIRFIESTGSANPPWTRIPCALPGRCTDSVFTLFTGDSAVVHDRFEIRAVDNQGAVDPTPAIQRFALSNLAPMVHITNPLKYDPLGFTDSSFASVTINWDTDDPDGGGPGLRYRIWLDRNEANLDSTTANTFTVSSDRFFLSGVYTGGRRTVFVQAVDDGGRVGPPDSTSWFVRTPAGANPATGRGRLLVIDDSRSTAQNNFGVDTMYFNTCTRTVPGQFTVQRLQFSSPFRSGVDLVQTLSQFDATVWYRGYEVVVSPTMQLYQDDIGRYIEQGGGGRIMLEGLYLFAGHGTFGTVREDFVQRYLNCQRLFQQFDVTANDSSVGLGIGAAPTLRSSMFTPIRPIRLTVLPQPNGEKPGLRGFIPNDTSQVALWAMPGALSTPTNTSDLAVGMNVDRGASGRVIVIPFSLRAMSPAASFEPPWLVLRRLLIDPDAVAQGRPNKGLLPP